MKPLQERVAEYRCSKCRRLYKRESSKQWITSYCERTGKQARLMRLKDGKR
jgi:ribosomal protein L37AE/L43A